MKQVLTDPYLDEIVAILKSYDPERIILFGSRARGEADEYSDYDLMVIKRTDRPFLDRLRDMVPYLRQITRPAEILVYTPEEFARMGETGLGWLVRQEGVTLYERPSSCSQALVPGGAGRPSRGTYPAGRRALCRWPASTASRPQRKP